MAVNVEWMGAGIEVVQGDLDNAEGIRENHSVAGYAVDGGVLATFPTGAESAVYSVGTICGTYVWLFIVPICDQCENGL